MTEQTDICMDAPFWVSDWYIDPSTGRIQREKNALKLEPKVMTVLVCLAQQAGKVISREQLESTAWSGMVVGYDSLASTIIKLRKAFGDDPKNPQIIETVSKKGYRLIAPVKPALAEAAPEEPSVAAAQTSTSVTSSNDRNLLGFAIVALVLSAIIWVVSEFGASVPVSEQGIDDRLSIAVLPFKNLSNDPEQEYFSDGITADIITDLSKISALSVIARNSAFTYKNTDVDVRDVGKDFGVRYVLEGSVRKVASKVRISARLIDARNGYNLWADRFDGSLKDVFALQDEVTSNIVSSLELTLTENERTQLAHQYTNNIEAYDNFLHGWRLFWELSKDSNAQAREYYKNAIELDKNFARAYGNMALTYAYDFINGWADDPEAALRQANLFASRAVSLDPSLPQVHWAMGLTHMFGKRHKEALLEAEKSIKLDPNFADGYGLLATALNYAAKPKEALAVMHKAMRLNPRHPFIYKVICGEIHFNLHDYKKAIDYFKVALDRNPGAQEPRLWLAAAYAHTGRIDDAKWELDQIIHANSKLTLARLEQVIPLKDPVQRKHLIDGLFKAGLAR